MNATTEPRTDIAAFAAAVRAELNDLPADEVDDLLDGLEADLSEQAEDSGEAFSLPDAATYAAELRAAAGLPERNGRAAKVPVREQLERARQAAATRIRSSRFGSATLDLLVSLRPVWWIARGVAFYLLLVFLTVPFTGRVDYAPTNVVAWAILAALVLLSIQWGRGKWLPRRWMRGLRSVLNVVATIVAAIALIAAPTVLPQYFASQSAYANDIPADTSQPGLVLDGERVRNIYAYDVEGNPLENVQLYTDQGTPLTTVGTEGRTNGWWWDEYFLGGGGPVTTAYEGTGRSPLWNVFPLREATGVSTWDVDAAVPTLPRAPFAQVPAVPVQSGAGAEPTPTPSPTLGSGTGTDTAPLPEPAPEMEVTP
ncbi:hypothetical protein SK224_04765 [Microbacterium sp. BG28]|uniref:hypothetical protein n=1 Tax=Microbacterium sp. BG28 TaxID=3097356 RepID=UPI002A598CD9|nr:hypothetical protein [Microbacterium sp. BG28]MDY0828434.1 hypothetical protein [Microbacterium sp. BG28]